MNLHKILRSPLLHFFALGALIFAGFAVIDDAPPPARSDAITLTPEAAGRLVEQFTATWNRPPTEQELEGLMRNWALEEANVREALALGLDRGDSVIRQRLNLKMQFVAESGAASLTPNDAELQVFLEENAERFTQPARVAFEQVVLPQDADATDLIKQLENGADPSTLGSVSLLPYIFPMTPSPVIERTFGNGFHVGLAELPVGRWDGPIQSGYGQHLVRVTERTDATFPPLSEIGDQVESEWRASEMRDMRESFAEALLDRYSVTLPDAAEVLSR